MYRTLASTLFILFSTVASLAQIAGATFQEFKISDVGTILVPTTMELQAGTYAEYSNRLGSEMLRKAGIEVEGDQIVFQQKGLNEFKNFTTYARVIVETEKVAPGEVGRLRSRIAMSRPDLQLLDRVTRQQLEKTFTSSEIRLLRWNGVSVVAVNGQNAVRTAYLRQLQQNPPVLVEIYQFQNYDRLHRLTISYRQEDAALWSDALLRARNSFTITNIR